MKVCLGCNYNNHVVEFIGGGRYCNLCKLEYGRTSGKFNSLDHKGEMTDGEYVAKYGHGVFYKEKEKEWGFMPEMTDREYYKKNCTRCRN